MIPSLPNRQLRNYIAPENKVDLTSLPNRQLRKLPEKHPEDTQTSLPNRQLRNREKYGSSVVKDFTAE